MVNININFKKKDLFLVLTIGIFVIGMGFVIAFNANRTGGNPAIMGHSADEIDMSLICTQAYVNSSYSLTVLSGSPTAVIALSGINLDPKFDPGVNIGWGIKCINGYQKMGCHLAQYGSSATPGLATYDTDLWPSADSCLADNEETYLTNFMSITCCKLG
jgi:hypothetical protein